MTDALATRLAVYGSTHDDSDWLDVRRRARRRRARVAVPASALIAAALTAGALAAGGRWVFDTHDRLVTARTDLRLGDRTWHVTYTPNTGIRGRFCATASAAGTATRKACREMGPGSPRLGPPLGAMKFAVPGGQIWVGATVGFARRVAITDAAGVAHAAQAVHAPKGTKTPFRYWAIAIASSSARSITAFGADGRSITSRLR
jgi:hypothetical protein